MRADFRNIKGFAIDDKSMALIKPGGVRTGIAPDQFSTPPPHIRYTIVDKTCSDALILKLFQNGHPAQLIHPVFFGCAA